MSLGRADIDLPHASHGGDAVINAIEGADRPFRGIVDVGDAQRVG